LRAALRQWRNRNWRRAPAKGLTKIARKGGGQYRITQGFGVFFCSCLPYKKHDKPEAAAGRKARKNYWQRVGFCLLKCCVTERSEGCC